MLPGLKAPLHVAIVCHGVIIKTVGYVTSWVINTNVGSYVVHTMEVAAKVSVMAATIPMTVIVQANH